MTSTHSPYLGVNKNLRKKTRNMNRKSFNGTSTTGIRASDFIRDSKTPRPPSSCSGRKKMNRTIMNKSNSELGLLLENSAKESLNIPNRSRKTPNGSGSYKTLGESNTEANTQGSSKTAMQSFHSNRPKSTKKSSFRYETY